MNKKKAPNRVLKTFLAMTLSASMILGGVAVADVFYPTEDNVARAAATTSSTFGSTGSTTLNWNVGKEVTFSGITGVNGQPAKAIVCKDNGSSYEMVFENVGTLGAWPGQNYSADASEWGSTTVSFNQTYGSAVDGNYSLLSTSSPNAQEIQALKTAAGICSSFGAAGNYFAWLGSPDGSGYAYVVGSDGNVYGNGTSYGYVLAPAFNLKKSYKSTESTVYGLLTGNSNKSISAIQSKTPVNSWETTAVASIVSAAKNNVTGTSDRYNVKSDLGYVVDGGTEYKPEILDHDITDTITVSSVDNPGFTAATFKLNVVGVPDSKLHVTSDKIASGRTYDLSDIASSEIDGMKITDSLGYIKDSKYVVPGTARDLVDKITFSVGIYSTTKEVNIAANTDIKQDSEGYYVVNDDNGIEWHFLYNDAGQIGYLYASSANVGKLVTNDSSKTLNVPSTINGVTVAGIGTNSSAHNFLNDTDGATGSTVWKNIYIPASVKTIRGYAFAGNQASAKVEIPSTVQNIEEHAFDGSSITEVKFDDASKLTIGESAFANISTLKTVTLRGNGAKIGTKAFYNDAIQKLNIPAGTTMEADGNSFSKNESLTELKIDATTVPDNSFVDTPKLAKVVFGENVKQVNALWTGKKAEAAGTVANRTTYALGKDTIFNCKHDGSAYYSPFGISGTLNVWGLKSDQVFNNGAGPVYAFNNVANIAYAKGEASFETTHISMNGTAGMDGLGDGDVYDQTGIEGSYSGTLLGGANATKDASTLNKNNMTVRKLFGTDAKGTYKTSDFYVMRSQVYDDQFKGKSFSNYTTEGNINTIKDEETQKMLDFYDSMDNVEVNDTDVSNGAITVTVVVLQTITADVDGSSKTYYLAKQNQDGSASMLTWTCEVTIPVKQYSEFNLFSDVYGGDFSKITQAISDAQTKNEQLQKQLDDQIKAAQSTQAQLTKAQADLATVNDELATANENNTQLESEKSSLNSEIESLNKKLADIKEAAGTDDIETLKSMKVTSDTYSDFLNTYKEIVDKVKNGEDLTEDDIISLGGQAVIDAYKKQIAENEQTITDKNASIEEMKNRIESLTTENTKLNSELEDAKNNVTQLEKDNSTTKTQLDNAKAQVTELENTISDNKATIEELNGNIADAQAEVAEANSDKAKIQESLDKAQENVKTLTEQNTKLSDEKKKIEAALTAAGQSVDDAAESITALKKNLDNMTASNEKQKADIEELNKQITDLNAEISTLQKKIEDYKKANETLATLAGIDISGKDSDQIEAALKEVIDAYKKDRDALQKIAEATGVDPTEATKNPTTLVDKIKSGTSGTGTSDDVATLKARIQSLESENASLKAQINSGSSSGSSSDSVTVNDLRNQLSTAQTNAANYKAQADTYKGLYETASKNSGTSADTVARIASLTTENASLTSKNKVLSDENSELTTKNKDLTSDNDTLTSKNKELSESNDNLTSKNKSLSDKNESLTNKNKALTTSNKSLKEQVSTLKKQKPKTITKTKTITKEVPKYVYRDSSSGSNSSMGSTGSGSTSSTGSNNGTGSTVKIGGTGNVVADNDTNSSKKKSDDVSADEKKQYEANIPSGNPGHISNLVSSDFSSVTDDALKDSGSTVSELGTDSYVMAGGFTTNCDSVTDTTDEQKDNANKILKYYAANPSLLTDLGVTGIDAETDDKSKIAVNIDSILSVDANPSEEQKKSIKSGNGADVEFTGDGITFEDGTPYLVVHESTEREGTYDALVVNAANGSLDFNLEDLSPISIAKVSVVTVPVSDATVSSSETGTEEAPEVSSENSGLKNVFLFILLAILFVGGIFVILLKTHVINLKGNSNNRNTNTRPSGPRV